MLPMGSSEQSSPRQPPTVSDTTAAAFPSSTIIQECRAMFGVKSVSKSTFKRMRNALPVVVFKMSNIRRIKLNNE